MPGNANALNATGNFELNTGIARRNSCQRRETNVNDSAYHSRITRSGRAAHVAIQLGLGILSQRRAWLGGDYCSYSGSDGASVSRVLTPTLPGDRADTRYG